jgi:hypothetical protein
MLLVCNHGVRERHGLSGKGQQPLGQQAHRRWRNLRSASCSGTICTSEYQAKNWRMASLSYIQAPFAIPRIPKTWLSYPARMSPYSWSIPRQQRIIIPQSGESVESSAAYRSADSSKYQLDRIICQTRHNLRTFRANERHFAFDIQEHLLFWNVDETTDSRAGTYSAKGLPLADPANQKCLRQKG